MLVRDVMTSPVTTASPKTSIVELAKMMAGIDSGAIPIVEEGRVVGLVTDRDIVLRAVAEGGDVNQPASSVMSDDVLTCLEEDNVADAAAKMGANHIRRLVVLNERGALAGIVSLGDIAVDYGAKAVGRTLEEISEAPATH